jgi:hypothetical protein
MRGGRGNGWKNVRSGRRMKSVDKGYVGSERTLGNRLPIGGARRRVGR